MKRILHTFLFVAASGLAASSYANDLSVEDQQSFLSGVTGEKMPAWLQRTDISVGVQADSKPRWSIETIQPLLMDENNTLFVQGRVSHKDSDETMNAGLGYRYLLDDKSWMLGANAFYDRTFDNDHERVGVGVEAFNPYATFRGNYYNAISGLKTVETAGGITTTERALDGWDVEAETPVPYVPWARFVGKIYEWDGQNLKDVNGYSAGVRMYPVSNLEIHAGVNDDTIDTNAFVNMTWYMGKPAFVTETLVADALFSSELAEARDLEKHRLEKVRRHNDIVVERRRTGGAGIVVGRGN